MITMQYTIRNPIGNQQYTGYNLSLCYQVFALVQVTIICTVRFTYSALFVHALAQLNRLLNLK